MIVKLLCFSSTNDKEDDDGAEFQKFIRVLADKVGFLSKHREELLDKYPRIEAANEQFKKELEEKKDLVKLLCNKLQLEKQVTSCLYILDGFSLVYYFLNEARLKKLGQVELAKTNCLMTTLRDWSIVHMRVEVCFHLGF